MLPVSFSFLQGLDRMNSWSQTMDASRHPSFMRACNTLGIKQIFTSFCNPKGNADTERMMRTMKEELVWSNEWQSYDELTTALDTWVQEYNTKYCHSALGYLPPAVFEKQQLLLSPQTPLVAA